MKTTFVISRDTLEPPKKSKELATFTWMIQQPTARDILARFGLDLPERFEITEHSNPDDPPDFTALGCGFEVTEFPPNLSAIRAVYHRAGGRAMTIPAFYRTGRSLPKIREEAQNPQSKSNSLVTGGFASVADEATALAKEFLLMLDGAKSKDVPGNDILLLDQRGEALTDFSTIPAIQAALAVRRPKHIKLIIMVRQNECVQVFP